MYIISDSAQRNSVYSALASRTRAFRQRLSFGEWYVSGSSREFVADKTYEKGIIKLDISQQGNSDGSGLVMGCCCSSSCTAEFYNLDKTYNYHEKIMFVECGVKLTDDSFFYIPCGYYKIENPKTDDDWHTVSVTAYDDVDRMSGKWTSALTYPSTAYLLLKEITDKYGIELSVSTDILVKLQKRTVTETDALTLTSYTEREVCGFIAGLVGANARMNTIGKMYVGWFSAIPTDDIPAKLQWQNGFRKTAESEFVVNSITSGINDAVFTAGTGTGITFANPIITEAEITAIYEKYGGMSFQPCTCEWRGNPCFECGDVVTVTDRNSVSYIVCIANQDIDLTGGLSMLIDCPGGDADISFDTVDERTRAALNKQKTDLQQAIIDATNKINGALGGYYEILDSDSDGNPDGWIIKETQDGSSGIIRANKAGIGLSTDGGKTYRTAITYNGINANEITSGKVKADFIETEKLIIGTGNVDGLEAELESIIDSTYQAGVSANNASAKATLANANANEAKETANATNLILGGLTALENGVTVIKGSTILTGSIGAAQIGAGAITAEKLDVGAITAEKVNVGWQSGNCATGWTSTPSGYVTVTSDSSYGNNPKITMSSSFTSGNVDVNGIPFYASAGDVLRFGGRAYKKSTGDNGIYLKYSEKSDGTYNLVENMWDNTSSSSVGATKDIDKSYTVTQPGWYMITVAFNTQTSGAYVTNLYCYKDVKGEMIVNGRISSVDGETYFDLDTGEVALMSKNNEQLAFFNSATLKYEYVDSVNDKKYVVGGIEGFLKNDVASQRRLIIHSPVAVEIGIGNDASTASGNSFYIAEDGDGKVVADCLCDLRAQQDLSVLGTLAVQKPIGSQGEYFTGLTHTRTGDYTGTIKAGVGVIKPKVGDSRTSAALELSLNGSVEARLDVIPSWGGAKGVIYLTNNSGKSAPLELGTDDMWFDGTSIMSAVSKINSTPIVDSGSIDFAPNGSFNTVYFNKKFTSTPNVVCTVEQFNAGSDDRYIVYLGTVTTTYFQARLIRFAGDLTYNCAVHWVAIGY